MITFAWFVAMILGAAGAFVVFVLNGSTPIQLGPIPFFGCAALFVVSLIVVIARLAT